MLAVYRLAPWVQGPKAGQLEVVRKGQLRYVLQPLAAGEDQLPEDVPEARGISMSFHWDREAAVRPIERGDV
jgi:hypothetical protein